MTSVQIAYWNLVELQRHNQETEGLTLKQVKETVRHNKATEELQKYQADKSYQASIYASDLSYAASIYSSDKHYAGTVYAANTSAAAAVQVANINAATQRQIADKQIEANYAINAATNAAALERQQIQAATQNFATMKNYQAQRYSAQMNNVTQITTNQRSNETTIGSTLIHEGSSIIQTLIGGVFSNVGGVSKMLPNVW